MPTIAYASKSAPTTGPAQNRSPLDLEPELENGDDPDVILPPPPKTADYPPSPWENVAPESTGDDQGTRKPARPAIRRSVQLQARRFQVLQQWEGIVTDIGRETFWGEVVDLTDRSNPSEVVEIPFSEIATSDRQLLKPGSVFYWSIGYETSPGGQIRRVSEIRARRSPVWSQHAVDSIKSRAKQLLNQLSDKVENGSTTSESA